MKYKIKDNKKFKRFILLTVTIISIFTYMFITILSNDIVESKSIKKNSIIVKKGDTIWSIAQKIDSNRDIRDIVYDIKNINDLSSTDIFPGNKIYLPNK